ncbi:unannotated protein [freshwater metagenome]|uniref:Unannotated protein n=1 Tax=freshwater metagenome TaxID=449393 RepID=A0A6J7CLE0_9ZZZZ
MIQRPEVGERVVQLLGHMVAMPTESTTPNRSLIEWAADHLQAFGATTSIIDGPEGRANLLATLGPNTGGGLLLSGHTDVVPAGGGWRTDPYSLTVSGDHMVGRGTADMKGFIACVLAVIEYLDPAGLERPVHLALSYDEEIGCVGVRGLLDRLHASGLDAHVRPDLVVIGEPTMMRPRHSHLGKVAYRVSFTAHAGHSSLSPFLPSAISAAVRMAAALEATAAPHALSAYRDDTGEANAEVTVNVGSISGGTALNVLAEHCVVSFELRHSATHDPDELLRPLWHAVDTERDALQAVGGGIDITEIARYPALATDRTNPWVRMVERAADRGVSTPLGFGTEGGLFARTLQAPVVVCGPGDIGVAHKPDEYVSTEQLHACVAFVDRLITDACTGTA